MSALRQAFFYAQNLEKKQGLRVPKSIAPDIYKIDANPSNNVVRRKVEPMG